MLLVVSEAVVVRGYGTKTSNCNPGGGIGVSSVVPAKSGGRRPGASVCYRPELESEGDRVHRRAERGEGRTAYLIEHTEGTILEGNVREPQPRGRSIHATRAGLSTICLPIPQG